MIEIKSEKPAEVRIYINDELFCEQLLPYLHCKLLPSLKQPKRSITVMNLGNDDFMCNNHRISPKQIVVF